MVEESLKSQIKKGLYWKFLEQFSGYGMQFVVGIFMARMLSPEDYGITALPTVFIVIAGIFADAGFGPAMIRKEKLSDEDLSTAFYYSTGVGILLYISLFIASPYIADFYNAPVLTWLIRVSSLGFLYGPIGTPQNIILRRRLDFKTPTKIAIVTRILAAVLGIAMAYYGYGVWALAIPGMIAGIISLLLNIYVVRWFPKLVWSKESFRYLWGFGNKLMASSLLDTIYNNITPAFIGKYYSPADLGVYNRALGYAQMPSQNIYGVIANVSYPVLSKIQNDDERLLQNYRRMIKLSAFVVFPLMMGLAALARPLVITMITEKWEACIIYLQIMCFTFMWWPIHALNLNVLQVKGRSDYFLKLEVVKKIWGLSVMAITLPMGVIYFCSAGIISNFFSLYVNTYYTKKLLGYGIKSQINDMLPSIVLTTVMTVSVWAITLVLPNMILQIITGLLLGMGIYISGAYLFKFKELEDVFYLLSKRN